MVNPAYAWDLQHRFLAQHSLLHFVLLLMVFCGADGGDGVESRLAHAKTKCYRRWTCSSVNFRRGLILSFTPTRRHVTDRSLTTSTH